MRKILLPILLLASLLARGQELPHTSPSKIAVSVADARDELEAMHETDQSHRRDLFELEKKPGRNSREVKEAWSKQSTIDRHNIQRLEEIIEQFGWPGRTQFGEKAARAAFLILQHSDISYQKKYLPLARAAAEKGEMIVSSLALLEDRIRLREGQKQIYGCQVTRNESSEWEPFPLEDEENVDALRASVGLKPNSEYLQGFAVACASIPPSEIEANPIYACSGSGCASNRRRSVGAIGLVAHENGGGHPSKATSRCHTCAK